LIVPLSEDTAVDADGQPPSGGVDAIRTAGESAAAGAPCTSPDRPA